MPKLTPLKSREVIAKLRALGFEGPFAGGRHSRMVHPKSGKIVHKYKSQQSIPAVLRQQ